MYKDHYKINGQYKNYYMELGYIIVFLSNHQ